MKLVRAAYIIAFVLAGLGIISALTTGPIVCLPCSLIPLMAGIGIARKRVWSAYGYALFAFAELLLAPVVLLRYCGTSVRSPTIIAGAVFMIAIVVLFLFAGRALKAAGAERGLASPWIAISVLCTLPFVFVGAFVIPSGAMEDTLLIGDHVLVQCLPKPQPTRGEIVAFVYPMDSSEDYVKRIIGVPGDRIRIANKAVYRNGALLEESYAVHKFSYVDRYRDNFPSEPEPGVMSRGLDMLKNNVVNGEVIVPSGHYFVLGDNRDDSLDSRYWGFISADDVIGRPLLIYDSAEVPSSDLPTGEANPFRRHTRWNRILKLL